MIPIKPILRRLLPLSKFNALVFQLIAAGYYDFDAKFKSLSLAQIMPSNR
jgi:hypothetical protein